MNAAASSEGNGTQGAPFKNLATGYPSTKLLHGIESDPLRIYFKTDDFNIDTLDLSSYVGPNHPYVSIITGAQTYINCTNTKTPKDFILFQNYSNPFNHATLIGYIVAEKSLVTIKVYDIIGREVITLFDEIKYPGMYHVLFNSRSLASGVYFYSLRAGTFYEVKRMLHAK